MQIPLADPHAAPAVGILDPTATLLATATLLLSASLHPVTLPPTPSATGNLHPPLGTGLPPLAFLLLADRLAELYAMVFPDWPEWLRAETAQWQNEEEVAAAVERFLQRVGTLFPVHDEIWDVGPSSDSGLEVVEWRLYEIPVIPMGIDEWYDGWDDLKEPLPYLLHAQYSRGSEDSTDEFTALYPAHQLPRYLEPHRLVEVLRTMDLAEPLAALPDLILMLNHATDNAWIDVGEMALAEGGGYPQWRPDEVAWLTAEWQKAQPILERIDRLLDWQNDTPDAIDDKLTAVRDVLLAAYPQFQETAVSP